MSWNALIDDLKTRDALADFGTAQTEATVAILATVMHADDRVGLLEQHEFAALVAQLPFYADKDIATMQVESAIARAKKAGGEDDYKAIIDGAAVEITDAAARREVFRLAATMALADHRLDAQESDVLNWLAAAFAIDDADTILAKLG